MFRKTVSSLMLVLLVVSMLAFSLRIRPVSGAETTIRINADGSITPSAVPILTFDNVTYWFTGNIINGSIIVQRSNVILEGLGHTLQGDGTGNGIYLSGMVNVTIRDLIVEDFDTGIWLLGSSGSIIFADWIINDNYGVRLDSLSNNNLVSGNSATNDTGGILVESSFNNNVSGNTVTNDHTGIQIEDSSYSTVSANNVANDSNRGVLLLSSSNTVVFGNSVTGNYYGVDLESSSGSIVSGNSVVDNSFGLSLTHSNGNTVFENNITQSYIALGLYSSSGNTVFGNTVANNDRGAFIRSSLNNVVYHNNFGNIVQVVEDGRGVWDHVYPSGGNYWSDYTGIDLKSGPNQDQTGSDGIGDTPYVIDNNNTDHYPLIMPWTPNSHDVAVNSIVPAKTIIAEGFGDNMTVAVANFGQNAETFNVTAYANSTVIGTQLVVNLTAASPTTLTFMWNTTGLTHGNYTLSAYAWPVSGETYTTDNNVTGGAVRVTILGDLNGDFRVSVQDLVILALAYGTKPGDQKWNPNADINGDNTVGPSDLALLVSHYGQPHPP